MTKLFVTIAVFFLVWLVVSLAMSVPLSWIWNRVAPAFELPQLTWQQMWAVHFICATLFQQSGTRVDSK